MAGYSFDAPGPTVTCNAAEMAGPRSTRAAVREGGQGLRPGLLVNSSSMAMA